jgi:hypothetical protein
MPPNNTLIGPIEAQRLHAKGAVVFIIREAEGFGYESPWDGVSPGDVFVVKKPPPRTRKSFPVPLDYQKIGDYAVEQALKPEHLISPVRRYLVGQAAVEEIMRQVEESGFDL